MQTVTIKKSFIGYVFYLVLGFVTIAALWFGIWSIWQNGIIDASMAQLIAMITGILILLIVGVQMYVYSLSYVELNETGITAQNYTTLFNHIDVIAEWSRVQDVTVEANGILSTLFGYGALTIQTAGTAQQLTMTMVPNPEEWQQFIYSLAAEATAE